MEMNDEDISQSSTDILKQETCLTYEKFNLSHSRPLKETLDLLEELSKDPVKKEEDIKRALDDVLRRLLDVVIPETESTLRQIQEKENAREDSFPHRDYFNAWWMLGKIHLNVLEAKEVSSDIMIGLNLAMQTSNYLSFLMEAKSDAYHMSSLSMCHYEEPLQFKRDCWTLKYHIQPKGEKREVPEKVKDAIQRLFAFPQNVFAHLIMELEMKVHKRSGEFARCLEFSKTMLPKLPRSLNEQLRKMLAELKAQSEKIEQDVLEVKDKVEPQQEEEWLSLDTLSRKYFENVSVPTLRRALKLAAVQPGVAGLYPKSEVIKAMKNYRHKNTRRAHEAKAAEKKQAAASPEKKKTPRKK